VTRRDVEGPIHRAVMDYLRVALPGAVIHHSANEFGLSGPNVARQIAKNRHNGMLVGFPDLMVLWHGNFWAFEVKAPKGKPTDAQVAVGASIERMGGKWAVVRSVDDAAACVAAWMGEAPRAVAVELRGAIK
jgi:hypothetical protein